LVCWLERGAARESGTATLYLTESHKRMLELIKDNEQQERASLSTASRVIMPATLGDRTPTVFQIGGGLMPDKITKFSLDQQSSLITAIIVEVIEKMGADLLAAFKYKYVEPVGTASDASSEEGDQVADHMIFIGSGLAARMRVCAVNRGVDSMYISMKNITRATVEETRGKVAAHIADLPDHTKERTTIVFVALENQAYTSFEDDTAGTDDEAIQGVQHYPGHMTVIPDSTFRRLVELSIPIMTVDPKVATVIVLPQPKYLNGIKCCENPGHVTNVQDRNFKSDILKGLATAKNTINKALLSGEHYLVRAVNIAPLLAEDLAATLSGADSESGYLPLEKYNCVIEEISVTANNLREKRSQYRGKDRNTVYNRNVAQYRANAGTDNSGRRAERGGTGTSRPFNSSGASYSHDRDRYRHRSEPYVPDREDRQRHRSEPYAPVQNRDAAYRGAGAGMSYDQPAPAGGEQPVRHGAVDIRYLSAEELEADARAREAVRSRGRAAGGRRGRGGIANLGTFSKRF